MPGEHKHTDMHADMRPSRPEAKFAEDTVQTTRTRSHQLREIETDKRASENEMTDQVGQSMLTEKRNIRHLVHQV